MKFGKSVSRLLAKFMLVSTTASCFGCCSYAMEDKNIDSEKNKKVILASEEVLRHACYMVIKDNEFRTLVRNYIDQEYKTKLKTPSLVQYEFEQPGRLLALDILDHKIDSKFGGKDIFSCLLPQFAEYYVKEIMKNKIN